MSSVFEYIFSFFEIVKEYNILSFISAIILMIIILFFYYKRTNSKKYKIQKITKLLEKDQDKALNYLMNSDMEIIEYFLDKDNNSLKHYNVVRDFLQKPERVKKIFNKTHTGEVTKSKIRKSIKIFSEIASPQSIDYLITYLYEDDPEIVHPTIHALASIDSPKVLNTYIDFLKYKPDKKTLSELRKAFLQLGAKAARRLSDFILNVEDNSIKIWCIRILGNYPEENFSSILIKQLYEDSYKVRNAAIKSLASFKNNKVIEEIIKLLEDENWRVRSQACNQLGKFQAIKAAPYLNEKLKDRNEVVRDEAAHALVDLGYKGIKYLLEEAKDPSVSKEVISVLKNQEISFLIESMEHIYNNEEKNELRLVSDGA